MLDISYIRDNTQLVKQAVVKKKSSVDIDELLELDIKRRVLLTKIDELKNKQKTLSQEIPTLEGNAKQDLLTTLSGIKKDIQEQESTLEPIKKSFNDLMLQVPQVPHASVPDGSSDENNIQVKEWGGKPEFSFEPKSHIDLMTKHGMVDLERGAKVHGFRGYYLMGDGARLSWAIWNYANQFFQQRGFVPVLPPTIVREENLYGTRLDRPG